MPSVSHQLGVPWHRGISVISSKSAETHALHERKKAYPYEKPRFDIDESPVAPASWSPGPRLIDLVYNRPAGVRVDSAMRIEAPGSSFLATLAPMPASIPGGARARRTIPTSHPGSLWIGTVECLGLRNRVRGPQWRSISPQFFAAKQSAAARDSTLRDLIALTHCIPFHPVLRSLPW
jgi:hypothetical protein